MGGCMYEMYEDRMFLLVTNSIRGHICVSEQEWVVLINTRYSNNLQISTTSTFKGSEVAFPKAFEATTVK